MSLLLLFRPFGTPVIPPAPVVDEGRGVGGELIWPADTAAVPARPRIPVVIRNKPIGKPKIVLELDDEELLLFLGAL